MLIKFSVNYFRGKKLHIIFLKNTIFGKVIAFVWEDGAYVTQIEYLYGKTTYQLQPWLYLPKNFFQLSNSNTFNKSYLQFYNNEW